MMAEPDGLGGSAYPPRTAHCGRGEGGSTVAPPSPLFTRDEVIIFTDGSCIRSGGDQIGGWAYSIRDRGEIRFGQGSASRTTNNRMELTAVIEALRAVGEPGRFVTVWSDSRYVVDGIAQLGQWHARGWKRRRGGLMANWDLWRELFAVHQQHGTEFRWVPAHAGNRLNEEVHALAFEAAQAADSRQL